MCQPSSSSPFTLPCIYALLTSAFIPYIATALSLGLKSTQTQKKCLCLKKNKQEPPVQPLTWMDQSY